MSRRRSTTLPAALMLLALLFAGCDADPSGVAAAVDRGTPQSAFSMAGIAAASDLVNVTFDADIPGQAPLTGGPGQPTSLVSQFGTSILVQSSMNGLTTQPVVLTAQGGGQFASVVSSFAPVADGIVRVEATVGFDRLVDGFFLQTVTGSGPFPLAIVTRLIVTASGELQDNITRTAVGTYSPNQPFRVRMDIDVTVNEWAASIDNELNGFDDDPVLSHLPFENPVTVLPTVGAVWASLSLFSTGAVGPTAVAYDDIRAFLPTSAAPLTAVLAGAMWFRSSEKGWRIGADTRFEGTVPIGRVTFHDEGQRTMAFVAENFSSIVVTGTKAVLQANGFLRGRSGTFTILAVLRDDGSGVANGARVRITDAAGSVVFDNQPGQPIDSDIVSPRIESYLTIRRSNPPAH